jgi:hypothetical protein
MIFFRHLPDRICDCRVRVSGVLGSSQEFSSLFARSPFSLRSPCTPDHRKAPLHLTMRKKKKKGKAHWTINEEREFINFLSEFKGEMSSNSFKDTVFQQAALHIRHLREKGAEKTSSSCKAKWRKVCISLVRVLPVY